MKYENNMPILSRETKLEELTPRVIDEITLAAILARAETCDLEAQPELAAFRIGCRDCDFQHNCAVLDAARAAKIMKRNGTVSRRKHRRLVASLYRKEHRKPVGASD